MSNKRRVVVALESGISIQSLDDISDAIGKCFGARGLILTEADLAPEFFELRTRFAGELFQKFVNYQIRLAIVLPDPTSYGERFAELAYEHSTHPVIRFVDSIEAATAWLEDS
jgi:uncharacterized protein DUF4180